MARKSKPWFRNERGKWYVQHRGRQVSLGPDKTEAERRWHALLALSQVHTAGDRNPFKVVADEWLDWVQRHRKRKPYRTYRIHLETFGKVYGDMPIQDLKPRHVDAVVREHPHWSEATVRGFMVTLCTCLNWAVRQEYIISNPFAKKLPIPPITSRGRESLISAEDYAMMLSHATPQLRDVLVACRNTGTRPQVVATVTKRHFDEGNSCWVMQRHKTDGKGEVLVVHLNDTMMALTRRLAEKYPEGFLFRNGRGNPWTDTALGKAMAGLRGTMKNAGVQIAGRGIMYGLRHSFRY